MPAPVTMPTAAWRSGCAVIAIPWHTITATHIQQVTIGILPSTHHPQSRRRDIGGPGSAAPHRHFAGGHSCRLYRKSAFVWA